MIGRVKQRSIYLFAVVFIIVCGFCPSGGRQALGPVKILDRFEFTEGPVVDEHGTLFFSDIPPRLIYRYTGGQNAVVHLDSTGGANGLAFGPRGRLVACAGKARHLFRLEADGSRTVLADSYQGKKLNSPNDLWIDPDGGIYFTDPRYGNADNLEQDGMHVYYLNNDGTKLVRIIDDLVRPNGITGDAGSKKLYVVDEGERKTWCYTLAGPGRVTDKKLFCKGGIDGMALTGKGRVIVTMEKTVTLFSEAGKKLREWAFTRNPTNVCYNDGMIFVTTQGGEIYKIAVGK